MPGLLSARKCRYPGPWSPLPRPSSLRPCPSSSNAFDATKVQLPPNSIPTATSPRSPATCLIGPGDDRPIRAIPHPWPLPQSHRPHMTAWLSWRQPAFVRGTKNVADPFEPRSCPGHDSRACSHCRRRSDFSGELLRPGGRAAFADCGRAAPADFPSIPIETTATARSTAPPWRGRPWPRSASPPMIRRRFSTAFPASASRREAAFPVCRSSMVWPTTAIR